MPCRDGANRSPACGSILILILILLLIVLDRRPQASKLTRQTSRFGELDRINPINIETISESNPFPLATPDPSMIVLAPSTSRQAAHSSADPRAVSKKWQRSAEVYLPFPSAMFSGIEVDARSNWL